MAGAVIRANRGEVSDRFPMLGFTVRTGARPYFETVVTTDPTLLDAKQREHRASNKFWSSRGLGPLPAERGEAVFIIPDDVLRRFAGAERLFYAVATFADRTRNSPEAVRLPPEATPFVSLSSSYTGRRLRQFVGGRGGGVRWNGPASQYAREDKVSLEWAGDAVQPGVETGSAAPSSSPGAPTGGGGTAGTAALEYDDGYSDKLWQEGARFSAGGTTRTPARTDELFDIGWADVPMIPQSDTVPGWLAAAAMVLGWRDYPTPPDPEQLLQRLGSLAPGDKRGAIHAEEIAAVAQALRLAAEKPTSYTVDALRELVSTAGPQWFGVAGPAPRYVVVTGLYGDGTPTGTYARISDPSPEPLGPAGTPHTSSAGMGSSYVLTFQQLLDAFSATAPGAAIQAIHVTEADMTGRAPLITSRAYATGQAVPSARPHHRGAPTARAAAVPAVVPIVTAIVGATMTRILNNEGDVSWELDQLKGIKHPDDDPKRSGSENFRTIVTPVTGWPKVKGGIHEIEALADEIYADFEMEWQCNGHSLGNLAIKNTHTNDAVGHGLEIHATINDDSTVYEDDQAALRVSFNYRFTRSVGSDAVAIRDFTLYADGTLHEEPRWTQKPDGWWGATEQRLGRAYEGGVAGAIAGEAVGPIIQLVQASLEDDIKATLPNLNGWVDANGNVSKVQASGGGPVGHAHEEIKGPVMWVSYPVPFVDDRPIRCDLLVDWDYDGSSIGNIVVRLTNPNDPTGGGLDIKGENPAFTTHTEAGQKSMRVRLPFTYNFSFEFDSPGYKSFDVVLHADGKFDVT
jgi:hypothetical protein